MSSDYLYYAHAVSCEERQTAPCHRKGTTWYGWEVAISEKDPDGVETPVDLTGVEILIEFRRGGKQGDVLLELTEEDCTIDGNILTIDKRSPANFTLGVGDWYVDLFITWPNGDRDPALSVILPVAL